MADTSVFSKIDKLISSSRFNESFLLIKREISKYSSLKKELDKLVQIESNYKYMLDYFAEGHPDPNVKDNIENIRQSLLLFNDLIKKESRLSDSPDLYSSTKRLFRLRNTNLSFLIESYFPLFASEKNEGSNMEFTLNPDQAKALEEIFNYVWTMNGAYLQEYEDLDKIFKDESLPDYLKSTIISALILGNTEYFEPEAFETLLNVYENTESTALKAKAIVGIVLISLIHSKRIAGNIHLRSRLLLTAEDPALKEWTQKVLMNIIKTYDTKRIDNKMRNEVIPGLMKINPEIINKMRDITADSDNFLSDDGNPNWEELFENSEIGDKLREINDLQMDGADVMVTAFSNLKNYPFFNNVYNWFLPFLPGNYIFSNLALENDEETISRLTSVMCESDIHSYLLSLVSIPTDKREMLLNNLESQMKEAKEALTGALGETEDKILERKVRHALQDLYRFFKFYRKKEEFNDPFATPFIDIHIQPLISLLSIDKDNIRLIAEFYFKNKYYNEAKSLFELIEKDLPESEPSLWEKIGYCYERTQDYEKAVIWYSKAEIINPGNAWLEKKLAVALKNSGKYSEALEYYKKSITYDPENYHLLMSAAQCYLNMGENEDALKYLYHARYIEPEKLDPQRAIAWAELLSGNLVKANDIYSQILESNKADNMDRLNAAHTSLASGDFKTALNLYNRFVVESPQKDISALVIALRDDSETLKKIGIKTSDLRLIVDKIRYDMLG